VAVFATVNVLENGPDAATAAHGPGLPGKIIFKQAVTVAQELVLTDYQRERVMKLWTAHASSLSRMFDQRKKLTANAMMLQAGAYTRSLFSST